MIEFDDISSWKPGLDAALQEIVTPNIRQKVTSESVEFIEDARNILTTLVPEVVDAAVEWLRSEEVAFYHGTRLTKEEVDSISRNGLIPLQASSRTKRLERALRSHTRWPVVQKQLREVIEQLGLKASAGKREGQVHATLSLSALVCGFPHYLKFGSEFDMHAAHRLLGQEGVDALSNDGAPFVVRLAVPGADALEAAHPFFSLEDLRNKGELPNLVKDFLLVWAYLLVNPKILPGELKVDSGVIFKQTVSADWITGIDQIKI